MKFYPLVLPLLIFCITLAHPNEPLENELNEFFAKKLESFQNIAASKYLRSTKLRTSENYLKQILKKQQTIYSILRVNTKGVVANEVTRQTSEPEEKYRNIANQKGFQTVVKTQKPYHGIIKNSNGRNYLMWIAPQFNSKNKFVGAVIAKIDIWDCIHEFSQHTDIHFLVKLGRKSLYSHKWKDGKGAKKRSLIIPGAKNGTILYRETKNRAGEGQWETVKDTFTTLDEKPDSIPSDSSQPSDSPSVNSKGSEQPEKPQSPALKSEKPSGISQGKKILIIVVAIGLITLLLSIIMIRKANQERNNIL